MKKLLFIASLGTLILLVPPSCGSHRSTPTEQPLQGGSQWTTPNGQQLVQGGTRKITVPNQAINDVISEARSWIGTPYVFGGTDKGLGTDCSGMVMTIYRNKAGVLLPRNSARQQEYCKPVKKKELVAGDLVFFSSSKGGGRVGHVGIYTGNGEFIHASSSRGVTVSRLDQKYFATHYHSAGRVLTASEKRVSSTLPEVVGEIHFPRVDPLRVQAEMKLDSLINALSDSIFDPNSDAYYEEPDF